LRTSSQLMYNQKSKKRTNRRHWVVSCNFRVACSRTARQQEFLVCERIFDMCSSFTDINSCMRVYTLPFPPRSVVLGVWCPVEREEKREGTKVAGKKICLFVHTNGLKCLKMCTSILQNTVCAGKNIPINLYMHTLQICIYCFTWFDISSTCTKNFHMHAYSVTFKWKIWCIAAEKATPLVAFSHEILSTHILKIGSGVAHT